MKYQEPTESCETCSSAEPAKRNSCVHQSGEKQDTDNRHPENAWSSANGGWGEPIQGVSVTHVAKSLSLPDDRAAEVRSLLYSLADQLLANLMKVSR